jgi:hypothetical protein
MRSPKRGQSIKVELAHTPVITTTVMRETVALIGAPGADGEFDTFTPGDWDDVKRQALAMFAASALDTPDAHLAYIRSSLAPVMAGHV